MTQISDQVSDLPIPSGAHDQQTAAFAGPPPLIAGERLAGYDELLARVCETLQPSDVLEHIWIRDVVDLAWDVFRLRRLKVDLMSAAAHEGMAQLLEPLLDHPDLAAKGWARRDETNVQKVEAALANAGLTMNAVAARTFSARIGDFERIDRMTMAAEARRNAALHELDRHRASFALRLRRSLQSAEEGEFEVIAPAALATPDLIRGSGQRGHSMSARAGHSPEQGSSARAEPVREEAT